MFSLGYLIWHRASNEQRKQAMIKEPGIKMLFSQKRRTSNKRRPVQNVQLMFNYKKSGTRVDFYTKKSIDMGSIFSILS